MKVAVIGAGLAGLAAACELADARHQVVVLERRPWAGGKTYSFVDRETGEQVDNGQHIAMRCTTAYVDFLRKVGTAHLVKWQPRLRVAVFDDRGRRSELRADPLPAPLHLAPSFVAYRHLSLAGKARVARGILAIRQASREDAALDGSTFGEWLRRHGQTESAIRDFWDLIVVPALNCRSDDTSASQAVFVFREGFLKSAGSAAIGVPRVGLSELHVEPALRYVLERGGEVRTGCAVERIVARDGRVEAIELANGERVRCGACVCALPPRELLAALPPGVREAAPFAELASFRTSPIVNLHLWFDGDVTDFDFAAFVGCDIQWIFNRTRIAGGEEDGEHLVMSLSAAERYMPLDRQELLGMLLPQMQRALPRAVSRRLLRFVAIKEPDATFVPAPGIRRPGPVTPIVNLFLAGAYTATGWPATMESAVRSGTAAARAVDVPRETSARREPATVTAA